MVVRRLARESGGRSCGDGTRRIPAQRVVAEAGSDLATCDRRCDVGRPLRSQASRALLLPRPRRASPRVAGVQARRPHETGGVGRGGLCHLVRGLPHRPRPRRPTRTSLEAAHSRFGGRCGRGTYSRDLPLLASILAPGRIWSVAAISDLPSPRSGGRASTAFSSLARSRDGTLRALPPADERAERDASPSPTRLDQCRPLRLCLRCARTARPRRVRVHLCRRRRHLRLSAAPSACRSGDRSRRARRVRSRIFPADPLLHEHDADEGRDQRRYPNAALGRLRLGSRNVRRLRRDERTCSWIDRIASREDVARRAQGPRSAGTLAWKATGGRRACCLVPLSGCVS